MRMRSSSRADGLVYMRMRVSNDRSARRSQESQRQQVNMRRRPARTLYSPTRTRCENGASQSRASPWTVNRASGDSARPKANQRPVAVVPPAADAFAHGGWGQRLGLSLNAFDLTRPRALDGASGPFDMLGAIAMAARPRCRARGQVAEACTVHRGSAPTQLSATSPHRYGRSNECRSSENCSLRPEDGPSGILPAYGRIPDLGKDPVGQSVHISYPLVSADAGARGEPAITSMLMLDSDHRPRNCCRKRYAVGVGLVL